MSLQPLHKKNKGREEQPKSVLKDSHSLSLLWPEGCESESAASHSIGEHSINDLDLDSIINNMCLNTRHAGFIRNIFLHLCKDLDVIHYRQNVLEDLLRISNLYQNIEDLLPKISSLTYYQIPKEKAGLLFEVTWRLGELEIYVECIKKLGAILEQAGESLSSDGLRRLRDRVVEIEKTETFQNLLRELPELLSKVRNITSITIGVNLDKDLQPVEATLVSINKEGFTGSSRSVFSTLFGKNKAKAEWQGIARLHRLPTETRVSNREPSDAYHSVNPMMVPLFRDLSHAVTKICRPISSALQRYIRINTQFLTTLSMELAFYLGAVKLIRRIQAGGLPMCKPEIAPTKDRVCELKDTYNINLALRLGEREEHGDLSQILITNDVRFGTKENIFILTGPNQSGKTTYMQAIGLVQVMAQVGAYVPGTQARLSPVEGIYTHFPAEERLELDTGRLGEEAKRLSDIFSLATRNSLLLLNESLSTTSPSESLYLAHDVIRILRLLGARAIYTTHLHELASRVEEINAEPEGESKVISMVSLINEDHDRDESEIGAVLRTFRIVPGPPSGRSYAREIASRYGISYNKLLQKLRSRGLSK